MGRRARPKRTLAELERKNLTELAVLCGEIGGSSSADRETSDEAHVLRLEWVRLQQAAPQSGKTASDVEAERASLKRRMAEFLVGARGGA